MTSATPTNSETSRRLVCITALTMLIAGGCSIGADDGPRSWSDWDPYAALPSSSPDGVERIYLLQTPSPNSASSPLSSMGAVTRGIDENLNPYTAILRVLFQGPTGDEVASGFRSSIPSGLQVLNEPRVEQGTVVVDLSDELGAMVGDNLISALAQIVLTLCERPETRHVQILLDGKTLKWPREDGTLIARALTPYDFPGFAVSSQPNFPGVVSPSTST